MKIAFLSCFDVTRVKKQPVWSYIAKHKPDALILLGDSIYMDFFPHLGRPRKFPPQKFLDYMYTLYKATWDNLAFRELVTSTEHVFTTWDDHDFAWNSSCGKGSGKKGVPMKTKLIAKHLHLQFRDMLTKGKFANDYPAAPTLTNIASALDGGINYSRVTSVGGATPIKVIMTDSRFYRENPDKNATLLGMEQRNWLDLEIATPEKIKILCTGSTLSDGKEAWDKYSDYQWLTSKNFKNFIVLSGDIHKNVVREHINKNQNKFYEFISSGVASPPILGIEFEGRWGLIEVPGDGSSNLTVDLYQDKKSEVRKTLSLP